MKKYISLLLLLVIAITGNIYAQTVHNYEALDKTATNYFEAYSQMNIDKMITFYHEDVRYIDETYIDREGKTADLVGKEGIKEAFSTEFFPIARKFEFHEESRFFSGNQGVFSGSISVHYKGSVAGRDDNETLMWTTNYTMVLTFKDGKIIRQNDFVNYRGGSQEWQ